MAYSRSRDTTILLCFGLFVLASLFCDCSTLTRLKALDTFRENSTINQGQAEGRRLSHGRLLIGHNSLHGAKVKGTKATRGHHDLDHAYQADMGWAEPKQPRVQSFSRPTQDKAALEQLLKMEPKVECTADSMKLHVQGAASTPGSLLFVDRGSRLSPLPLSKLPASCGYTIRSTQRDLVLVAPYDGCFVAHQEDNFVLPLHWCGVPVRMLCPSPSLSSPNPPMVTCHTEGMVVKTEWTISAADIKVNINGNWVPLMEASPRCGFSVVVHPEGVVISVHYAPCLEKKGGLYTLELAGDGEIKISCPSLSAAQSETPSKGVTAPTPSYNFGPAHVQTQRPQPAVPQVPDYPQKPEAPEKKPTQGPKDISQPQFPYYFYPHFPHPHPGTKPSVTVQPLPSQPAKVPTVKEPPVKPSIAQIPNGRWGNPLYPYFKPPNTVPPAHWPDQKPLPTSSPSVNQTTKGQRQQLYYPFYFFTPTPETPPTQPPVTNPPGKMAVHILPNPFNPASELPQKPIEPPTSQPEGHVPFNPFPPYLLPPPSEVPQVKQPLQPVYPKTPGKQVPENIVPPKPPVPQEPQGKIYPPLYHYPFPYPFHPHGPVQTHMPPTPQTTTSAPKSQVQQSLNPVQPESAKPQVPVGLSPSKPATEEKGPSQPEVPRIHQYPYMLYPHPEPTERPTIVPSPQPEAPRVQIHQYPYGLYPHPESTERLTTVEPPRPEAPQVHQYPYALYPHPEPTERPSIVQPPQPEATQVQVHQYPYGFYPYYKPTERLTTVQPPQPEAPRVQVHQYPYGPYPHPEPTERPTTVQPPQSEAPRVQVHQYPYGLYPHPEPTERPTTVQPPQPEAPRVQVHQYPYGIYPHPQPTERPTTVQPPRPEAPQVHQYPYALYPYPEATEKPTTVKPPQPGAPWGHVHQPFVPFYPQPKPENRPGEKPSEHSPGPKPPDGQVYHPFKLYYPQQPEHSQPVTLPPVASIQQPQAVTSAPPNDGGMVPQAPQPGAPHMSSLYCPQFCPTGFANCCPQIAFHQHVHHIVPPGPGSKDIPPVYSALPFGPSLAYSGFTNGLGAAVIPQKPSDATMQVSSSAPTSPQAPPPANEEHPHFLPPDGNPAAPSISKRPVNPQPQIYPFVSNWPHLPHEKQNLPQSQSTADHNVLSKPQASGNDPVNPMVQYKPYYIQYPDQQVSQPSIDMNGPSVPNLMYFIGQYQQEHSANQQNEHAAKQLETSHKEFSDSKGQAYQVQGEFDQFSIPYGMLQDAQAPTYNLSQPQPFVSGSKTSKHDQNVNPRSESKSYVLLQHGPPGREPNSFRDLAENENLKAQTFARHHSGKDHHLQNLISLDKHSHLRWLEKMPNALPVSASDGPRLLDSPKGPTFSAAHVKPEFRESLKDMWKPLAPSNRRIPANVPREAFQHISAAADLQGDGLNQDIQREGENQET